MGLYTDDSNVTPYDHSGDPFIDAFLINQYGSVWAAQAAARPASALDDLFLPEGRRSRPGF